MVNAMFPMFLRVLVLLALAAMVTLTQTPPRAVNSASVDKSQQGKGRSTQLLRSSTF